MHKHIDACRSLGPISNASASLRTRQVLCGGPLEAERQFRRIVGYRHIAELVIAIERDARRAATGRQSPTVTAVHSDTAASDTHTDTHVESSVTAMV